MGTSGYFSAKISQEKIKTMLMQNFGGQTKSIIESGLLTNQSPRLTFVML